MQQMIEVHPSQLRWAMHNLSQRGVPIHGYSALPNGMCVIVVLVPDDAPATDWQEPPPRAHPRRWPRIDPVQVAQWLGVAAFAAGLIWFAWSLFAGGSGTEPPAAPAETASAWDWLDNLRLPWEPEPLPDGEPVVPPADDAGFRWPWDAAADAAADTADAAASVQGSITAVAGAVVAALGMLIILAIARRRP